jgi:hypothetical protein
VGVLVLVVVLSWYLGAFSRHPVAGACAGAGLWAGGQSPPGCIELLGVSLFYAFEALLKLLIDESYVLACFSRDPASRVSQRGAPVVERPAAMGVVWDPWSYNARARDITSV